VTFVCRAVHNGEGDVVTEQLHKRFLEAFADLYAAIEAKGHVLQRKGSEVDDFVHEYENHNGPGCEVCGESWCQFCVDVKDIKECVGNG
jgi:hypothetical protein